MSSDHYWNEAADIVDGLKYSGLMNVQCQSTISMYVELQV